MTYSCDVELSKKICQSDIFYILIRIRVTQNLKVSETVLTDLKSVNNFKDTRQNGKG